MSVFPCWVGFFTLSGLYTPHRCQSSDHPSVATYQGAAYGQPTLPGLHSEGDIKPQPVLVPAGRRRGPPAALLLHQCWPRRDSVPGHFTASRPQDGRFFLRSEKLLLNDSGLYLCAWSITLRWVGQTSVQKPHPTPSPHHPLQGPSLRAGAGSSSLGFSLPVSVRATESSQISPKNLLGSSQGEHKHLCLQTL